MFDRLKRKPYPVCSNPAMTPEQNIRNLYDIYDHNMMAIRWRFGLMVAWAVCADVVLLWCC